MQRPRYSLASLLGIIAGIGVGCAGLRGNHLWFSGLFTATMLALLVGVLGAIYRRGAARAFFTGAVLFGSAYLVLVYFGDTNHLLLTDKFLRAAADWPSNQLPSPPSPTASAVARTAYQELYNDRMVNWRGIEYRTAFEGVGHLLFSWMFALVGGLVARTFAGRDRSGTDI